MSSFKKIEIDNLGKFVGHAASLLFQCGYVTALSKERVDRIQHFQLGYPNKFVEAFVAKELFENLIGIPMDDVVAESIKKHVAAGDMRALFEVDIKDLFSSCGYSTTKPGLRTTEREEYYHNSTFLALRVAGVRLRTEAESAMGSADLIIELPGGKMDAVLEIKCAEPSSKGKPDDAKRRAEISALADKAMQQIKNKRYVAATTPGRGKRLVVAVFDPDTKTVADGGVLVEDLT